MNNTRRKKIIQHYYSRRAKDYDRQKSRTWKTSQGFGPEVMKEMLKPLAGFENKHVLEVGVGSGRNALPLMEKIKPQFLGLDLSKEMLKLARSKISSFKRDSDLILADAEHLPFTSRTFDAVICMSTMHYFESQEAILKKFSAILKEKGVLTYGDLTIHEADDEEFFEKLERTLSKAHTRYCKPSEARKILETCEFHVSQTRTVAYRKSYLSLMEDKGQYFNVPSETLQKYIHEATTQAKIRYGLTDTELTLYYTIITARKEK